MQNNRERLLLLARTEMPFGKYKGRKIIDLPEPYLLWLQRKGFPENLLGELLHEILEIKINGLEGLIRKLK